MSLRDCCMLATFTTALRVYLIQTFFLNESSGLFFRLSSREYLTVCVTHGTRAEKWVCRGYGNNFSDLFVRKILGWCKKSEQLWNFNVLSCFLACLFCQEDIDETCRPCIISLSVVSSSWTLFVHVVKINIILDFLPRFWISEFLG